MDNFVLSSRGELYKLNVLTPYMTNHAGFIAGGCFKNLFNGEQIKDIDVFFKCESDYKAAVFHYENDPTYKQYYSNKKVTAFRAQTGIVVELIKSTFGHPKEILSKFDFSIVKFAYYKVDVGDSIRYSAMYHEKFFEHLHLKKLVLNETIHFPISTFERSLRYTKYGYGLCKESKRNLLNAIRNTPTPDDLSNELYNGID